MSVGTYNTYFCAYITRSTVAESQGICQLRFSKYCTWLPKMEIIMYILTARHMISGYPKPWLTHTFCVLAAWWYFVINSLDTEFEHLSYVYLQVLGKDCLIQAKQWGHRNLKEVFQGRPHVCVAWGRTDTRICQTKMTLRGREEAFRYGMVQSSDGCGLITHSCPSDNQHEKTSRNIVAQGSKVS